MTVAALAERDGTDCSICGDPVDMSISRNDDFKMCPSIDHVIPRSRGGTDDPSNLALAHLSCNCRKSNH
jgi:5-methylcytosine-specific restriction endonuclease McrA